MTAFPLTDWQRLEALRTGGAGARQAVLGELFARYREPILAFLRRKGSATDRAEDLVQAFFVHSIEHGLFEQADPARGRFRNLMLKALDHFAANVRRAEHARMRRPAGGLASIDGEGSGLEPGTTADDPERAFVRAWANAVVRRVLDALFAEYDAPPRHAHREIFRRLVVEPILDGASPPSQRALAATLGLTEKEVANRLVTARRAYRRLLLAEVAAYVRDEAEAEAELRELFEALGGA